MNTEAVLAGTVHTMPADLRQALTATPKALAAWNSLTPLARNEWICWNTIVKQAKTRSHHIKRTINELQEGKRRPCCWLGCLHRKDKPLSRSAQWILSKKTKSN